MLGRTKNEDSSDPWPVVLPGEENPVLSTKIEGYLNAVFWHYYQFYFNTKHAGPPLSGGWTEWPPWIPQLLSYFDNAIEVVKLDAEKQAYK